MMKIENSTSTVGRLTPAGSIQKADPARAVATRDIQADRHRRGHDDGVVEMLHALDLFALLCAASKEVGP